MDLGTSISGLFSPTSVVGLSVYITADNSYEALALELFKRKKGIDTRILTPQSIPLESLTEYLPINKPVHLVLDGKGIVHRKLLPLENQDPLLLLFPNARKEDFITQSVQLNSGEVMFSLIRSEQANSIIIQLYQLGFKVISLSLGPFSIQMLKDKLQNDQTVIPHWEIKRVGSELVLTPFESATDNSVYLDSKPLPSLYLTSFAVAFQALEAQQNKIETHFDLVNLNRKEEIYRVKFNRTAIWFLTVIFIILTGNFLFIQDLSYQQNELTSEMNKSTSLIHELDSLKSEYQKKSSFLSQSGFSGKTRYSQYADEMAMHLQSEITLTRLDFNPPISKPKTEQEIFYNQRTCIISGRVLSGVILDQWLNELKMENWVKDAAVLDYRQEESQLPATFSLRVSIR